MKVCRATGDGWKCDRRVIAKGLCNAHYQQHKRGVREFKPAQVKRRSDKTYSKFRCEASSQHPLAMPGSSVWECDREVRNTNKGLCDTHYMQTLASSVVKPFKAKLPMATILAYRDQGLKQCCTCKQVKSFEEFYKSKTSADSYRPQCVSCIKWVHIEGSFHLTQEGYWALLDHQNQSCAICNVKGLWEVGTWHIDHDHSCCSKQGRSCGKCIRGLLCSSCNAKGLSWYENLPADLRNIPIFESYLSDPPAKKVLL